MPFCSGGTHGQRWHGANQAALLKHLHAEHPNKRVGTFFGANETRGDFEERSDPVLLSNDPAAQRLAVRGIMLASPPLLRVLWGGVDPRSH
jgi:hypothetical protein